MEKASYSGGGKFLWFFQRFTGFLLMVMLLLHIYLLHFAIAGESPTYQEVMSRMGTPFWKSFDLVFLYLVIFHGLNGLWQVLIDYFHRPFVRVMFFSLVCFAGLIMMVVGTLTIFSLPVYY